MENSILGWLIFPFKNIIQDLQGVHLIDQPNHFSAAAHRFDYISDTL